MNVLSPAIHSSSWSAHDSAPKAKDSSDAGDFLHALRRECSSDEDSSSQAPDTPAIPEDVAKKSGQPSRGTENSDSVPKSTRNAKSEQPQAARDPHPQSEIVDPVALSLDAASALAVNLPGNNVATPAPPPAASNQSPSSSTEDSNKAAAVSGAQLTTPQPVLGNLAFALRIQSSSTNSDAEATPAPQPLITASSASSLISANVQTAAPGPEHKFDTQLAGITAIDTGAGHRSAGADSESPAPAATPATANSTSDFETELNKFRSAEPVRGAHVQISGADSQRVDIRLIERAGTLSVAVRSSDSTLTRSLQEHAPELNASLHLEHFHTELWTPESTKSSSQQQSSGNPSGNSYSGGSGNNPQQQNRKNQQQPEWSDEIESHSATLQNRIEYTWHQ